MNKFASDGQVNVSKKLCAILSASFSTKVHAVVRPLAPFLFKHRELLTRLKIASPTLGRHTVVHVQPLLMWDPSTIFTETSFIKTKLIYFVGLNDEEVEKQKNIAAKLKLKVSPTLSLSVTHVITKKNIQNWDVTYTIMQQSGMYHIQSCNITINHSCMKFNRHHF